MVVYRTSSEILGISLALSAVVMCREPATFRYAYPENISGWTWLAETALRSPSRLGFWELSSHSAAHHCDNLAHVRRNHTCYFSKFQLSVTNSVSVSFSGNHGNYCGTVQTVFCAGRWYREDKDGLLPGIVALDATGPHFVFRAKTLVFRGNRNTAHLLLNSTRLSSIT
jgi:hypothetical protein